MIIVHVILIDDLGFDPMGFKHEFGYPKLFFQPRLDLRCDKKLIEL